MYISQIKDTPSNIIQFVVFGVLICGVLRMILRTRQPSQGLGYNTMKTVDYRKSAAVVFGNGRDWPTTFIGCHPWFSNKIRTNNGPMCPNSDIVLTYWEQYYKQTMVNCNWTMGTI